MQTGVHERFLRDELDVVVATVAFGMGASWGMVNMRHMAHLLSAVRPVAAPMPSISSYLKVGMECITNAHCVK